MNTKAALCSLCLAFTASMAHASPTLTVGTPGDSLLSTPSKPTPELGGVFLNFDSLSPLTSYTTYTSSGVSISSPDGLVVYPYSTQSGPNELFDNSASGTANILISLTNGTSAIGFGVADSDPVSITIQALGAGGSLLGSPLVENLATTESAINVFNGYYVLQDTTPDIFGLELTQTDGSANYSGLAIDDVQLAATPEPASVTLLGTGLLGLAAFSSLRRLKQA